MEENLRQHIEAVIARLRSHRDGAAEQADWFKRIGATFSDNGKDITGDMIADYETIVERTDRLIHAYQRELDA